MADLPSITGCRGIFSLTAALGMLADVALVTSGLAALGLPLPFQLLAFTIVSAASVVLIPPAIARYMRRPQPGDRENDPAADRPRAADTQPEAWALNILRCARRAADPSASPRSPGPVSGAAGGAR